MAIATSTPPLSLSNAGFLTALFISFALFTSFAPPSWAHPLDTTVYATKTAQLAPGIIHRQITGKNTRGPVFINVLDVDLNNPEVRIEPVLASKEQGIHGKVYLTELMHRMHYHAIPAVAAINGSYFKPDVGTTLGAYIHDGQLISGPIYNRVAFGITQDKQILFDQIHVQGKLLSANGNILTFQNINQPRLQPGEWVLYNSAWGDISPATPSDGIQIQVHNNLITQISKDPLPIPKEGFVLLGPSNQPYEAFQVGDTVTMSMDITPNWSDVKFALSGGPYLLRRGQIYVDAKDERLSTATFMRPAPRTAVGVTPEKHLLMVTVDGRQDDSVGMTLYELAYFLKSQGAVYAINLDGGTSTQMAIGTSLVNRPEKPSGSRIGNGLVVIHNQYDIQTQIDASAAYQLETYRPHDPTRNRPEANQKPFSFLD